MLRLTLHMNLRSMNIQFIPAGKLLPAIFTIIRHRATKMSAFYVVLTVRLLSEVLMANFALKSSLWIIF